MDVFPFIVGRGRSGTTLLRAMFDSHPDMAIPDETHFLVGFGRKRRRYERPDGFCIDAFMADLAPRPGFLKMGVAAEAVEHDLRAAPPAGYADAIRRIFALYAAQRGKHRFADKTPIHVLNLPFLAQLFPEARFIHIIRDGRDVALSYLDVAWGYQSLEEVTLAWKRAVEVGRRAGRRLGPGRYQEIRYETLVDEPEASLRQLSSFVELSYDPAMLRYFERAEEVIAPMGRPEARQGIYLPPTKGIRDWRLQMSNHDVALFEALAGSLLSDLGYERATTGPSRALRLEAYGRWLRVQSLRLAGRGRKLA